MLKNKGSKCKCNELQFEREQKVCSSYCKHLSAHRQRKVVKKLMLDYYNKTLKETNVSHFDKEPRVYENMMDFGKAGDRKFFVDAVWWRQWCDYVNFNP